MRSIIIILLCSLALLQSCKPKQSALEKYDRATLLKSVADNVVVPFYASLKDNNIQLYTAAQAFQNNVDANSLLALKAAWNNSVTAWMHAEMFGFYYASDNSLNSQIASWPVDFSVIETEVHGSNVIDEAYITATGTTRKGLSAVEYLLYGSGISEQAVLDSFNISASGIRRKQYLLSVCAHIKSASTQVYNDWNGGTSYNSFTTQTQLDISGAMNLLVNSLVEHIEFVRKSKVGKPLGIDNGGSADGLLCENRLAPRSIENIRENILAWKEIVKGGNGVGLDDYMDYVGAQYNGTVLSSTILNQLDVCLSKTNDITVPLNSAVTQQQSQVQALYLELKKLTVLTKVDMASNLGVVITFSDNDGD